MTTTLALEPPARPNSVDRLRHDLQFEFVRATENAALQTVHWLGRGAREQADAAACDAIRGVLDQMNIRGLVAIGEGVKDDAPGVSSGQQVGRWSYDSPRFDIALDPIDGTSNVAYGLPNAISAIAASQRDDDQSPAMLDLPGFYSRKLAYGPAVVQAMQAGMEPVALADPVEKTLSRVADALEKPLAKLVVVMLNRQRHAELIATARRCGVALRLIADGDLAAAISPALPDSGVDLYCGIGGSAEGVLAAAALQALGGDLQLQMWRHDDEEWTRVLQRIPPQELERVFRARDLVKGRHSLFCATGISDSSLLPGVRLRGSRAVTYSVLMCAHNGTVRYTRTVHDLKSAAEAADAEGAEAAEDALADLGH